MWHRMSEILQEYDATTEIGLPATLINTVRVEIDVTGDELIHIPQQKELIAALAMTIALDPMGLSGKELRFLREAIDMTGNDFAEAIDCSPEVLSRWENEKQPMGGYLERVIRQLVCEEVKNAAPGVSYDPGAIPRLKIRHRPEGVERRAVMRCERVSIRDAGGQRANLHWLGETAVAA